MTGTCEGADDFGSGTDDAQHTPLRIPLWQITFLNGAQGFGRSGVTSQYYQLAPHLKKSFDSLTRKLIDHIKGTCTIRCACIVAQVQEVVLGQQLADAMQNGQSAISTVKDSDGTWCAGECHVYFNKSSTAVVMSSPMSGLMNGQAF